MSQAAAEPKWIEWTGGDCPLSPEVVVDYLLDGETDEGHEVDLRAAGDLRWTNTGNGADIIAYKVMSSPVSASSEKVAHSGERCGHGNFWGHCCRWVAGGNGEPLYKKLERELADMTEKREAVSLVAINHLRSVESLGIALADARRGHLRYEYVRTLSPHTFGVLWDRSVRGDGTFDALVDAAITARSQEGKS